MVADGGPETAIVAVPPKATGDPVTVTLAPLESVMVPEPGKLLLEMVA